MIVKIDSINYLEKGRADFKTNFSKTSMTRAYCQTSANVLESLFYVHCAKKKDKVPVSDKVPTKYHTLYQVWHII